MFANKVLNFVTKKVLWKKVLEIKSLTILRLNFLGLSGSRFNTKKSPEKSTIIVENAWEQRMFTTMEKQGFDNKNAPSYIQYADT